jgi:hypothetical protein
LYLIKNNIIMVLSEKEALTLALVTTVTAPDDKHQECLRMAQAIADRLTPAEVEACKIAAEIEIKKNWSD